MADNKPPAGQPPIPEKQLDKWSRLKLYVARRHDYFEAEYRQTNFAADEAQMAFYRALFEVMRNLEEDDARNMASKKGKTDGR